MRIHRLDPNVVSKVAATEIIGSPVNALKEILENSLDAGSTNIEISVKDGGFKLLQVTDNGDGIDQDDLVILCERHTTSKLKTIKDLESMDTLGFRGEALASISHISHVSVVSKTKQARTATRAEYEAGKMTSQKPIAGVQGTVIAIEDLFFNTPSRVKALKGRSNEEYQKILDVVCRYAINYAGTFSCRRDDSGQPYVIAGATAKDKIRRIYGPSVANDLIEIKIESVQSIGLKGVTGYVSNADYFSKKGANFIFFVNDRLVSSEALRRGIQKLYSQYVPKGAFPFIFLSLKLDPDRIDVNVHPSKREVRILDETEVVDTVVAGIEEYLSNQDTGRKYKVQSFIASSSMPANLDRPASAQKYEYHLVRTDPQQSTLASFARTPIKPRESIVLASSDEESSESPAVPSANHQELEFKTMALASIAALKQEISDKSSTKLTKIITNHSFVGLVDVSKSLAAIQYDVRLYLIDYHEMSLHLFYQIALTDLANFGTVSLGDGLVVSELLEVANKDVKPPPMLLTMAPMLEDYFRIKIKEKDGQMTVTQLPLLLENYILPVARLPDFFVDLAQLEWADEEKCLGGICMALAKLYQPVAPSANEVETIFNAAKRRLVATNQLGSSIVEIANLPGLYRVFERC